MQQYRERQRWNKEKARIVAEQELKPVPDFAGATPHFR
jgi:hypothetical protein